MPAKSKAVQRATNRRYYARHAERERARTRSNMAKLRLVRKNLTLEVSDEELDRRAAGWLAQLGVQNGCD